VLKEPVEQYYGHDKQFEDKSWVWLSSSFADSITNQKGFRRLKETVINEFQK